MMQEYCPNGNYAVKLGVADFAIVLVFGLIQRSSGRHKYGYLLYIQMVPPQFDS